MSNMSYCMFRNTLSDLDECINSLNEGDSNLSQEESSALRQMITNFHSFLVDNELLDEDGDLNEEALDDFIYNSQE